MAKKKKTKLCSDCNRELELNNFHKNANCKYGRVNRCRDCTSVYNKKWRKENKDKAYFSSRKTALKRKYGITMEDYNNYLDSQNGCCAICGKKESKCRTKLNIDHNHKTGYIRGLLCRYCNSALLRFLRDNKNRAFGMSVYLLNAIKNDKKWE